MTKSEKYNDTYRIPSARAPWWNYGWNGFYFITLCTQNREHFFGEIKNSMMQLSPIGEIGYRCWREIPDHFPFVKLGAFVVIPNHVHGIIGIDKQPQNAVEPPDNVASLQNIVGMPGNTNVETQYFASLHNHNQPLHTTQNKFGPQSQNLGSIVRGFKIGITKNAREINPEFSWQSRFYDHIIRNETSFNTISEYINNNPAKWKDDKFYL